MNCEYSVALSARTIDLDVARAELLNLFDGPRLAEKPCKWRIQCKDELETNWGFSEGFSNEKLEHRTEKPTRVAMDELQLHDLKANEAEWWN